MFAGNCRDSAGGFLQYLQGKPCNIYRIAEIAVKICIYYRAIPADIAENPRRVPANICSVSWILVPLFFLFDHLVTKKQLLNMCFN